MITKFKIFETIYTLPEVGNYVILKIYRGGKPKNAIGEITTIKLNYTYPYTVDFIDEVNGKKFNITDTFKLGVDDGDTIECWSDNKEELEKLLASKKYNI
jgi:hypothetical protein